MGECSCWCERATPAAVCSRICRWRQAIRPAGHSISTSARPWRNGRGRTWGSAAWETWARWLEPRIPLKWRCFARMPNVFFLVPGFGAQGGAAEDVRAALPAPTVAGPSSTVARHTLSVRAGGWRLGSEGAGGDASDDRATGSACVCSDAPALCSEDFASRLNEANHGDAASSSSRLRLHRLRQRFQVVAAFEAAHEPPPAWVRATSRIARVNDVNPPSASPASRWDLGVGIEAGAEQHEFRLGGIGGTLQEVAESGVIVLVSRCRTAAAR